MVVIVVMDITLGGGIERITCLKANSLIEFEEICIVSIFKTNKVIPYHLDSRVNVEFLSDISFSPSYKKSIFRLIPFLRVSLRPARLVVSMYPIISISLAMTELRVKLIASEHSEYFSQSRLIRLGRILLYNRILKVVTLTNKGAADFRKDNISAIQIPNFTDFELVDSNRYLGEPFVIIFVGRYEEVKNPLEFIKLADILHERFRGKFSFRMYGEGTLSECIETMSNGKKYISIHPFTKDVENIMERSHAIVVTSKTEAFPMVVLEGLAKGLIVYGFDSQIGTNEILGVGSNQIVKEGDLSLLADQIARDFSDSKSYKNVIDINKRIIAKYSEEQVIKKWVNLLGLNIN